MGIRQEVAFREKSEIFKRLAEVANVATLTPAGFHIKEKITGKK